MFKRTKLWTSISAITLVGVSGLTACSNDNEPAEGAPVSSEVASTLDSQPIDTLTMPQSEGEGEGSSSSVDLATDDLAYLTQLNLMRGHLYIGHTLFKNNHFEHAKTHMKHPENELYADIEPAFAARKITGFADELSALAESVNNQAELSAVDTAYKQLIESITRNQSAVKQGDQSVSLLLKQAVELLRIAGDEYAIAVVDGKMMNAHEYQDALGFTTIALDLVSEINSDDQAISAVKIQALQMMSSLKSHWPSLMPPQTLSTDAGALHGIAAEIELLALGLE